jgi:hypothetical protein
MDRIGQLFDLLDQWRHLPAYQLERRADILFALYLPGFLSDHLNIRLRPQLIPEFPLRKELGNQSCKIDYIAISEDGSKVLFVELKTDKLSRSQSQDAYLLRARIAGMRSLLEDLLKIVGSVKKPRLRLKYSHLLKVLEFHELVRLQPSFYGRQKTGWRGFKKDLGAAQIAPIPRTISIHYLQPIDGEKGEIGFGKFAEWVDQFRDPVSTRFSESLREWAKVPAGEAL